MFAIDLIVWFTVTDIEYISACTDLYSYQFCHSKRCVSYTSFCPVTTVFCTDEMFKYYDRSLDHQTQIGIQICTDICQCYSIHTEILEPSTMYLPEDKWVSGTKNKVTEAQQGFVDLVH